MKRNSLLRFFTICLLMAIAGHVITYLFVFVVESKTDLSGSDNIRIELTKAVQKECGYPESI